MNLFGTFSYGKIIKTFIPGVFLVLSVALWTDNYNYWRSSSLLIFEFSSANPVLSIALLIPLSIFMGIISNSFCFTTVIPKYIEQPFKNRNAEFLSYKEKVINEIREYYMEAIKTPEDMKSDFKKHFDVRSFLLHKKDLSILQYLRESYWYFMEFQVNSIVVVAVLTAASATHILLRFNANATPGDLVFPYLAVMAIGMYFLCTVFKSAAIENYEKHEKKMLSYLQGAYYMCRYGSSEVNANRAPDAESAQARI